MRPEPMPPPGAAPAAAARGDAAVGRLPEFHVVGFTGHRRLTDGEGAAKALRSALEQIRRETPGEWIARSSIASGGDRLFVREAHALGMSWHAILPMPRAEFAHDFAPSEWPEVEATLATADHVRVIADSDDREEGYLDCGIETVNEADVLLALWDGDAARGKGGTADIVQYAKSISKPLIIVDAATNEVRRENWDQLEPGDPVLADLNELPDARSAWSENPFKAPNSVFLFQQKCDHWATQGAPQFRRLIVATVAAHVLATLIGTAVVAYDTHILALPWIELACVGFALSAALVLRHKLHSHHSWVRCRLAAEFCRSALATWGLPRAAPLLRDLDLAGVRALTRSLYVLHARSSALRPVPIDEFKRIYLEKRVEDQLAYYERQVQRAAPLFRRLTAAFSVATILAFTSSTFYTLSVTFDANWPAWIQATTYVYLPITLPVLAAAAISIISINDLQRRVARYREMRIILQASRAKVNSCQTWNSLEHVVLKTERALLQEVIEWHSTRSFSSSH
jgi:hypothetical protein